MGIYNTNSYNPLGSIQAALNNVNEKNRIKNEYWKNKGQIWSNFAQNIGNIGNRMLDGIVAYSEGYDSNDPEARLAALEEELKDAEEAERIQSIQDKYNAQVAQRQAMDDYLKNSPEALANRYAMAMRDYKPNFTGYDNNMKDYKPNFGGYNLDQFQGGVYPEQEMQDFYRRGI